MGKTLAEKILSKKSGNEARAGDIVIAEGRQVTYDMKLSPDAPGVVGTSQVADAVIEKLKKS